MSMHVPTVTLDDLAGEVSGSMVVLDVREQSEWVHGHIDGAHHIPLSELGGRLADVPDEKLLVVCKIGGRSAQAVAWLSQHGHDAYNLAGGMIEWAEAGRPMVSEIGSTPHVV
jgi:rhodanese-related sulfurtransferase